VLRGVADKVQQELEASGYAPRMHERDDGEGLFEISIPGHGFDLEDFKTLARISEDFGVGLRLGDDASITLA
jgi:hypothetical protein